ncbi:MAG TPA: CHASE domain-containing protein [Usitatibacter sp.]|nr:CHASE domain-containing protein [Usitatibacter sp.]
MNAPLPGRTPADRIPAAVLLCGLAVTFVVAWLLATTAAERDRQEFEAAAQQAQAGILAKVETSVALLRGAVGLFATQQAHVTVPGFRAYVDQLALRERYPGILGIGFARRVRAGEEAGLAFEMRIQGHAGFHIWPEAPGEERTAIVFIEPLDERNRAALGYDMFTDPVRREAMARARDTGAASASAVVTLVQEIDAQKQPGFLIYLPVYAPGPSPATAEARRERLLGYAYSPIRAGDFLSSAFAHEKAPAVGLTVYGARAIDPARRLYERGVDPSTPGMRLESTVDVLGQPWTFAFRSVRSEVAPVRLPAAAAVVGTALSLLLAILVRRERKAHGQAQHALDAERAARAEAENANRVKDQFFATLSHELRTPLNAILGWTALLRMPALAEDKRRGGVDVIERSALAQSRLIEDLLDMSRIGSGKMHLEMQELDARTVVADTAKLLAHAAGARQIALAAHLPPEPAPVRGDPARLQQVVSNLVSNAVKFTPPGGRIDVTLDRHEGRARITVADTGEGIEAQFLERMFQRFTQADGSSTRRHGGLGLGLAIVRELVDLHGGTVTAESEGLGRGSRFVVELPLVEPDAAAMSPSGADARDAHMLHGVRVLVVDDDAVSRELARDLLRAQGADVRAASSARQALEAIAQEPPDVLLSDIGMPEMDGYALLRRVRALRPEQGGAVPAAAITAYARDSDREAALAAGFDRHIAKPLRGDELARVVAALVTSRSPSAARAPAAGRSTPAPPPGPAAG